MKDEIFTKEYNCKFAFDDDVADVFDDMIERSVPFYKEIMNLSIYFISKNIKENDVITDLGCSTGNFLINLKKVLQNTENKVQNIKLIGIDNSSAMIKKANEKLKHSNADISFICNDFTKQDFERSNFFIAHYTMQFVRPLERINMIQKIYDSLSENGIFFMAEKTISHDNIFENQMIKCFYDYKKTNGYTQTEIARKREALENILVPFSVDENIEMLQKCGFKCVEVLFKWVNFTMFMARK